MDLLLICLTATGWIGLTVVVVAFCTFTGRSTPHLVQVVSDREQAEYLAGIARIRAARRVPVLGRRAHAAAPGEHTARRRVPAAR